jgi:hypothetical protein
LTRKLLVLNLVLVGLTAAAAIRLRQEWLQARAREQAVLRQRIKPVRPPVMPPLPPVAPIKPAGYIDIAQKMLFSKDRNPTVIVEVAPPPKPKPMPPLPVFHGLLNLGDGPAAILSEKPGAQHRDFRPGEQVGEFKLVAVDTEEIVLEWDGQEIRKDVHELLDRTVPPPSSAQAAVAAAPPPAAAALPAKPAQAAPGIDLGGRGIKACQNGDNSPPGTVAEGMRKVIKDSPFGRSCYWEPAN